MSDNCGLGWPADDGVRPGRQPAPPHKAAEWAVVSGFGFGGAATPVVKSLGLAESHLPVLTLE